VPPSRSSRPRLIVGGAALLATAAVATLPLLDPGPLDALVEVLAALALASALIGVVGGFPAWGSVTAGVLGAELLATLHEQGAVIDGRTPAMAAGLLLVAELVTWAAEQRTAGAVVGGAVVPRPALLAGCTAAAYAAALLLAAVAALPLARDLAVTALGAGAVALVTAVVVALARARV
jgi:hypothetical protein